uniref:Uncharacterized protein n=1 Tax=Romanomermis culicivorax TaxID=13658 RepID=A0A915HTZ3_ROMCU
MVTSSPHKCPFNLHGRLPTPVGFGAKNLDKYLPKTLLGNNGDVVQTFTIHGLGVVRVPFINNKPNLTLKFQIPIGYSTLADENVPSVKMILHNFENFKEEIDPDLRDIVKEYVNGLKFDFLIQYLGSSLLRYQRIDDDDSTKISFRASQGFSNILRGGVVNETAAAVLEATVLVEAVGTDDDVPALLVPRWEKIEVGDVDNGVQVASEEGSGCTWPE